VSAAPLRAALGTRKRRIALLFHARTSDRDLRKSVVFEMASLWREAGYEVIVLRGAQREVPADLVFVHVDLSVVPDEYLAFAARYPIAVKGLAKDIRKSTTSRHRVRPGDPWSGPVIAKSDLNCAGRPERAVEPRWWLRRVGVCRSALRLWDGIGAGRRAPPFRSWRAYQIFAGPDRVPRRYFEDPRIAGKPVLLDANKTTGRALAGTSDLLERRRFRAEGIDWFFEQGQAR
jgi:hypothetical protein